MCQYKLFFMARTKIVTGVDLDCVDDDAAQRVADQRLAESDPVYDAIETWQGLRLVCRRERPRQNRKRQEADLIAVY
jgi:hypothetical protein